jgi:hypothetical protein
MIVATEQLAEHRRRVAMVDGGFDPLHPRSAERPRVLRHALDSLRPRRRARIGAQASVRHRQRLPKRVPACGTNDEVLRAHGLDATSLAHRLG